jgi:hypothetical protein
MLRAKPKDKDKVKESSKQTPDPEGGLPALQVGFTGSRRHTDP